MRPGNSRTAALAGFIWGFAEATLFFIVPDVLFTSLALNSIKRAVTACLAAALGATTGGLLIWTLSSSFPSEMHTLLLMVPGISEGSFLTVQTLYQDGLYHGMIQGAFSGVPYKIFAAEAGVTAIDPVQFALLTPVARLPRFLLLSVAAWFLSALIGNRMSSKSKLMASLSLWAVFYVAYFKLVGW